MKVSIITVTYNSEKTIKNCIDSVNSQTYKNIEHIIIDGSSVDRTVSYITSTPNRVKKIVSEPDKGIYDAMNKGIRLATGDVVGTLNSDDVLFDKHVIDKIVKEFDQYIEIDCLYGNLVFVNEDNKVVRKWKSKNFEQGLFEKSWTPAHPTFYCRKSVFEKYGLYKIDYKIAADVEFMLRLLELNKVKSHFLNKFLVSMTIGGVSTNGISSTIIITKEMKRAFEENDLSFNILKYLFYKFLKVKEFFNYHH